MKRDRDAYGEQLLAQFLRKAPTAEIIEREDGYIDTGSHPGSYFRSYEQWPPLERQALRSVRGKVLDIGCGAGRHSIYLQEKGFDVTGIDASPGAVRVCKSRGLKKALVRPIAEVDKFRSRAFDTVLMLGNNFGLLGNLRGGKRLLRALHRITSPDARIIAETRNPEKTRNPHHLAYQRWNQSRGRMRGQIRIRIRFEKTIGEWFDYLFVSPDEMRMFLEGTGWEIERLLGADGSNYCAILRKKERSNKLRPRS